MDGGAWAPWRPSFLKYLILKEEFMQFIKRFIFCLALPLAFLTGSLSAKQLKVVTTTPDLASIAREVGGDRVKVESLASPFQDPHFVDAKPSLIVKLMDADLFIETGLELE